MKNNDLICCLPSIITVSCSCCVLLDVLFIFNNIYFTVHIFNNHHITRKVGGDNTVDGTVNCSCPCWSRQDDSNHDELGCDDVARSAPSSFGSSTPNTLFLLIASSKLKCSFTL